MLEYKLKLEAWFKTREEAREWLRDNKKSLMETSPGDLVVTGKVDRYGDEWYATIEGSAFMEKDNDD